MSQDILKLFVLEDDEVDQIALDRFVTEQNLSYDLSFANSLEEGKVLLSSAQYDAAVMDYRLNDGNCFELFDSVDADTPIIVVTGFGNEEIAVRAMKSGATDYLVKDERNTFLRALPHAISRAMRQKIWEQALRRYESIFASSTDLLTLVSRDYVYLHVNDAYLKAHARSRQDVEGRMVAEVLGPEVFDKTIKPNMDRCLNGDHVHFQDWFNLKGMGQCYLDVAYYPYYEKDNTISGVIVNVRNITDMKRMEDELGVVRHMEALGELSAGIAHQFNNSLSVVIGNVELLQCETEANEDMNSSCEEIKGAVKHMGRLTAQLLAYSRGGKYFISKIRMNDMIRAWQTSLRAMFDASTRIDIQLAEKCPYIEADETQILSVLNAVAKNVAEACSEGRHVRIETDLRVVDNSFYLKPKRLGEGDYVAVKFTDNCGGMPKDVLDRIFEPFYTTKFIGRGLGMAAAYGIIYNHNGWIDVTSELGLGTTVTILLPAIKSAR